MNVIFLKFISAFTILMFLLTGCVSSKKYQKLEMENQQNKEIVEVFQGQLEDAVKQIDDMQRRLVEFQRIREKEQTLTEKELLLLKQTHESLKRDFQKEITSGQIEIEQLQDRMTLKVYEKLFFNTGKVEIKPEGQEILRRLGSILKTIPEKNIRIEGHTDNIPIGPVLQAKYPTNWELAAARALNVVHFLKTEVGIDPLRLSAVSFGQYRPIATNMTEAGRAKNRRIEIVLIDRDLDVGKKMK